MFPRLWALLGALVMWLCFAQAAAIAQPTTAKTPADKLADAKSADDKAKADRKVADADVLRLEQELAAAKKKAAAAVVETTRTEAAVVAAKKEVVADATTRLKDLRVRLTALKKDRPTENHAPTIRLIEAATAEITDNGGTVPPEEPVVVKADPPAKKAGSDDPPATKDVPPVKKAESVAKKVEPKATFASAPVLVKTNGKWEPLKFMKSWSVYNGQAVNVVWAEETGPSTWNAEKAHVIDGKFWKENNYYVLNGRKFEWYVGDHNYVAGWYETSGEDVAKAPTGTPVYYHCGSSGVAATPRATTGGFVSSSTVNCIPCQSGGTVTTCGTTTTGLMTTSAVPYQHGGRGMTAGEMQHARPRLLQVIAPNLGARFNGGGQSNCQPGMPCWGQ